LPQAMLAMQEAIRFASRARSSSELIEARSEPYCRRTALSAITSVSGEAMPLKQASTPYVSASTAGSAATRMGSDRSVTGSRMAASGKLRGPPPSNLRCRSSSLTMVHCETSDPDPAVVGTMIIGSALRSNLPTPAQSRTGLLFGATMATTFAGAHDRAAADADDAVDPLAPDVLALVVDMRATRVNAAFIEARDLEAGVLRRRLHFRQATVRRRTIFCIAGCGSDRRCDPLRTFKARTWVNAEGVLYRHRGPRPNVASR